MPLLILEILHAASESAKFTLFSAMVHAACVVRSFGCPRRWCQIFASAGTMAVASIAGVVVVVSVGSPGEVVDAEKDALAVKAKAATMMSPLIRHAPKAEVVFRSVGRLGATLDVAMNGRVAGRRGATATMARFVEGGKPERCPPE